MLKKQLLNVNVFKPELNEYLRKPIFYAVTSKKVIFMAFLNSNYILNLYSVMN